MTATILHLPQTPVAELTIADVRRLRPLVSQAATETLGRLDALPITADRTALEAQLRRLERMEKELCDAIQAERRAA